MKPWNELTICDNFIFSKVMRNENICKTVVEGLLNIKVKKIKFLEYEKTLKEGMQSKGIRMDIYLESSDKIINLEMQTTDNDILPKRARYYHSLTDLNILEIGQKYKDLKDSYIVFICTFDPFHKGLPMYSFEYYCKEAPELNIGNGQHDIYFNAPAYAQLIDTNPYIAHFLEYVATGQTSPDTDAIDNAVKQTLQNEEWRKAYMLFELELQDAEMRGETHGILSEKSRMIKILHNKGFSLEEIAEMQELSVDVITNILKNTATNP